MRCSLQFQVAEKNPGRKEMSYYGIQAIASPAAFLFCNLFECCYVCALALWRLATNGDYRTIAHLFGVSRASVRLIVRDVCDAIVQVLLPKYIQTPHGERLRSIVDGFASKWGLACFLRLVEKWLVLSEKDWGLCDQQLHYHHEMVTLVLRIKK